MKRLMLALILGPIVVSQSLVANPIEKPTAKSEVTQEEIGDLVFGVSMSLALMEEKMLPWVAFQITREKVRETLKIAKSTPTLNEREAQEKKEALASLRLILRKMNKADGPIKKDYHQAKKVIFQLSMALEGAFDFAKNNPEKAYEMALAAKNEGPHEHPINSMSNEQIMIIIASIAESEGHSPAQNNHVVPGYDPELDEDQPFHRGTPADGMI